MGAFGACIALFQSEGRVAAARARVVRRAPRRVRALGGRARGGAEPPHRPWASRSGRRITGARSRSVPPRSGREHDRADDVRALRRRRFAPARARRRVTSLARWPRSKPRGSSRSTARGSSEVRALDGVDLEVQEGTVLGLLGPNGAGQDDDGPDPRDAAASRTAGARASAGSTSRGDAQAVRKLIGLSGQYAAVDENLTGRENLWMFGRLYQLPSAEARRRADELLVQFDARGRRRPRREDVLGRHAAAARPRLRARRAAAAPLPRRADDRARPTSRGSACGT